MPLRVAEGEKARSPLAGTGRVSPAFLDQTIEFWQPRTSRTLTREDAREIVYNLSGFFAVLREWQEAERVAARRDVESREQSGRSDKHQRGRIKTPHAPPIR